MNAKLALMRKKLNTLQNQRSNQLKRSEELEAAIDAAEEVAPEIEQEVDTLAAAMEETQNAIKALVDAIAAEEAAAAAAIAAAAHVEPEPTGEPADDARKADPRRETRARDLQRTGHVRYDNPVRFVRSAITTAGTVGPTGVGGINDAAGIAVSGLVDLIKMTDCTGMASYKVAYMSADSTADNITEGTTPTESEPTFNSVTLTPASVGLISYISREIRKQSPLLYEEKVNEAARRALRRKLNNIAATAILASTLNTTHALTAASTATSGDVLFDAELLSNIILAYGGDEGVEGNACLFLNKKDLKAFAAVRGVNEYFPAYSIVPDSGSPSTGVIKDNNGLSCRYCISKDVTALSDLTLSTTAAKTMFYGNPQCAELAMWGGYEVDVNEGYKFGEGLLTIRGEVTADIDVTTPNGFVVVTAKKGS